MRKHDFAAWNPRKPQRSREPPSAYGRSAGTQQQPASAPTKASVDVKSATKGATIVQLPKLPNLQTQSSQPETGVKQRLFANPAARYSASER
jgi:hypothetical protein